MRGVWGHFILVPDRCVLLSLTALVVYCSRWCYCWLSTWNKAQLATYHDHDNIYICIWMKKHIYKYIHAPVHESLFICIHVNNCCVYLSRVIMNCHYSNVIMDVMVSQITSLTIVYSTVYSGADHGKYQSSTPLAFVRGIHWSQGNSPHKRPVTRKCFHLMMSSCVMRFRRIPWTMGSFYYSGVPDSQTRLTIYAVRKRCWRSFICCNRYSVKQEFYYYFFCKFCQVFTYFDMFYYSGHQSSMGYSQWYSDHNCYKLRDEITSPFQTSTVRPLQFGDGLIISPQTLVDMWLFIHAGIKVSPR